MDTQPAFGFKEVVTLMAGDIAKAVSERDGETTQQQLARAQVAVNAIMAFVPRDAIEVMLAGRCLMFHELMVDSVRAALRGERDATRRATDGAILAMDRAFRGNLGRLRDYQRRPDHGRRDEPEAVPGDVAPGVETTAETPRPLEATVAPVDQTPLPPLNRAARRAAKVRLRAAQRAAASNGGAARQRLVAAPGAGAKDVSDSYETGADAAEADANGHAATGTEGRTALGAYV